MFLQASYVGVKPSVYNGKFTEDEIEKYVDILIDFTNEDDEFSWNYDIKNPELFIRQNFSKYLALFGNKKTLTIYRGLQFASKQKMIKFLDAIEKTGLLVENRCRSWTFDQSIALNFYQRMTNLSYGCILKQRIKPYEGIQVPWNAKRMEFANEKEVILAPAKFKLDDIDWSVFPISRNLSDRYYLNGLNGLDSDEIDQYFKKWLKQ